MVICDDLCINNIKTSEKYKNSLKITGKVI